MDQAWFATTFVETAQPRFIAGDIQYFQKLSSYQCIAATIVHTLTYITKTTFNTIRLCACQTQKLESREYHQWQ